MKRKLFTFIFILLSIFGLASCNGGQNEIKVTTTSISIVETSIPQGVFTVDVMDKLSSIEVLVTKSDGSTEVVSLSTSMIPSADQAKLITAGTHTISVKYLGKETTFTITIVEPEAAKEYFTVKVVYPDGTPVNGGVHVQWCTGNICELPVVVNEEGIATLEREEGDYYIHIEHIPAGYTYDPNAYTTNTENKNVVITLLPLSTFQTGNGTVDTPYVVTTSTYKVTFEAKGFGKAQYFSFTPTVSGTYSIKSIAMDKLAINTVDPYITFLGTTTSLDGRDVTSNLDSKVNINFTHEFEAVANQTYYFALHVSSATSFDNGASFEFIIFQNNN